MKRNKWINCLFSLCIIVAATACYEDKGNYDYDWVPDVCLQAKLRDTFVERGAVMKITPELGKIIGEDTTAIRPEDYTFRWEAVLDKDDITVIGTRQNLDDTIWLTIGKTYQVNYIVREKASGVQWLNRFKLRVVQRLTGGYLFMTEDENKQVELEIWASDSKGEKVHETGVLARSGFPYTGGGANGVANIFVTKAKSYLWVATGQASAYLKLPDFSWEEKQMARMLMAKQEPVSYTFKSFHQFTNEGSFYLTDQGNAHVLTGNGVIFPDYAFVNNEKFKASPYLGGSSTATILFDENRGCFLLYAQGNSGLVQPASMCMDVDEKVAFKGSTLYYMQLIAGSVTVAVFKDAQGIYRKGLFRVTGSRGNWKLELDDQSSEFQGNIAMIEQAGTKVVSWNYGKLYFTLNGKLYTYRDEGINECLEVNLLDEDGNRVNPDEVVAVMMINNGMTGGNYRKYIYVSTYSPENGGRVYVTVPQQAECRNLDIEEVIKVDGKVKSLCNWSN